MSASYGAKFAGDSSEPEVRKLEKEVFTAWARSVIHACESGFMGSAF